jgi:hypothetical protein
MSKEIAARVLCANKRSPAAALQEGVFCAAAALFERVFSVLPLRYLSTFPLCYRCAI